ncbi:hypothetical protein AB9G26_09550 [Francisella philomiragia]|uniref:hypothetical protein n=1 Tax=Francisella philomiragia TaxID=28110 RepID=UPI0035185A0B
MLIPPQTLQRQSSTLSQIEDHSSSTIKTYSMCAERRQRLNTNFTAGHILKKPNFKDTELIFGVISTEAVANFSKTSWAKFSNRSYTDLEVKKSILQETDIDNKPSNTKIYSNPFKLRSLTNKDGLEGLMTESLKGHNTPNAFILIETNPIILPKKLTIKPNNNQYTFKHAISHKTGTISVNQMSAYVRSDQEGKFEFKSIPATLAGAPTTLIAIESRFIDPKQKQKNVLVFVELFVHVPNSVKNNPKAVLKSLKDLTTTLCSTKTVQNTNLSAYPNFWTTNAKKDSKVTAKEIRYLVRCSGDTNFTKEQQQFGHATFNGYCKTTNNKYYSLVFKGSGSKASNLFMQSMEVQNQSAYECLQSNSLNPVTATQGLYINNNMGIDHPSFNISALVKGLSQIKREGNSWNYVK